MAETKARELAELARGVDDSNITIGSEKTLDVSAGTLTTSTAQQEAIVDGGKGNLTASDVGLGNVTNESKATMFTNPTFTGTSTIATADINGGTIDGTIIGASSAAAGTFSSVTIAGVANQGFPSGTKMLFQQTSAPTGWTKDTTHNDKALRVVSGTVSSGGSVAFTTAFASKAVSGSIGNTTATNQATTATNQAKTAGGTVGNRTLSTSQMPSHSHTLRTRGTGDNGAMWHRVLNNLHPSNGDSPTNQLTTTISILSTGGGGSHNHSFTGSSHNHTQNSHNHTQNAHNHSFTGTAINMAVQYVDLIIATKD